MVDTEVGTDTLDRELQLRKAADSMTEMVGGRVREVMPV
jgi:hypothetical protein